MDSNKWLYVRFPRRIKDEFEVKELHEDITSVKMPRQRGRFCWVGCENEETARKVQKDLNKKPFEKGNLIVTRKLSISEVLKKKASK